MAVPITNDPSTWRLSTANGVKYKKMEHSGSITWDSISIEESYVIQASDLISFIRSFFPLPELNPGGLPIWTYGVTQGKINIAASSLDWEAHVSGLPVDPFSADAVAPDGTYGQLLKVTVKFDDEVAKPDSDGGADPNDPQTFLEISCSPTAEFLHSPAPDAEWVPERANTIPPSADPTEKGDEKAANATPTIPFQVLVPETEWTLTWPRVDPTYFRTVMLSQLRAGLGHVNEKTFDLCYGAAPETLLFVGFDMSQERQFLFNEEKQQFQGFISPPLNVSMKFVEKHVAYLVPDPAKPFSLRIDYITKIAGHNHQWRPEEGWRRLLYNGTDPLFDTYDFDKFFSVVPAPDPISGTQDE